MASWIVTRTGGTRRKGRDFFDDRMDGLKELAVEVVRQAANDLKEGWNSKGAAKWFLGASAGMDIRTVCEILDVDPELLAEKVGAAKYFEQQANMRVKAKIESKKMGKPMLGKPKLMRAES
jgi:hypothetical protein